jgi:hypothetical protein
VSILDIAGPIVQKLLSFIPDPAAKASAQLALFQAQQAGEFKQIDADLAAMTAQADINKVEAASPSLFKSGWRPFVGWVCAAGLVYGLLICPLLPWVVNAFGGHVPPMPALDSNTLMSLLVPLLGLGAYRTFEKSKGVA